MLQSLADVMFQMTRFIMYLAPLAAGAAIAYTVGNTGLATLLPFAKLVVTYYIALTAFAVLVMIPVMAAFRVPLGRFFRAVGEPAAIGFAIYDFRGCSSTWHGAHGGVRRASLDRLVRHSHGLQLQHDRRQCVSLDGCGVRRAGCRDSSHVWTDRSRWFSALMAASKGIAGVPRASLVVLLATASAVHLPTAPILLILGVDTLMDMGRTMMNVVGNCMAAAVIGKTEGAVPTSLPADELQV